MGIEPIDRARLSRTWPDRVDSKPKEVCTPAELSAGPRSASGSCKARSAHTGQIPGGPSERSGFPQRLQRRISVIVGLRSGNVLVVYHQETEKAGVVTTKNWSDSLEFS